MHVTLIRPPALTAKWVPAVIATPPLAHAYLAAVLQKKNHDVSVIDAVGEAIETKTIVDDRFALYGLTNDEIVARIPAHTGLIGISSMFSQEWPNVMELIRKVRERFPTTPIVCGGEHVSAEPVYSMSSAPALDYIVMGEGEETLSELASRLVGDASVHDIAGLVYRDRGAVVQSAKRARI
jgi:radical SAM superfamily enzyme YgiQ (UPF0313 family)